MDGSTTFALIFISFVVFGPLVLMFLEYGLDPIAKKLVDYIESRNNKEERS